MEINETTMRSIIRVIGNAKHVWIIGDGGSAALADHFACDLLKNCHVPAISLCSNTALLTALGNDYSFDDTFLIPVDILFKNGDILVVFSTSGKSQNLINAAKIADNVISFIGGNEEWWERNTVGVAVLIDGKDQMDLENKMLEICHAIARELQCVKQ